MDSLVALHLKVDALTRVTTQLLRSLADEEEQPESTLDGGPAGRERDTKQGL